MSLLFAISQSFLIGNITFYLTFIKFCSSVSDPFYCIICSLFISEPYHELDLSYLILSPEFSLLLSEITLFRNEFSKVKLLMTPNSLNITILAVDSLYFSILNLDSLNEKFEFFYERSNGTTLRNAFLYLQSYRIPCSP